MDALPKTPLTSLENTGFRSNDLEGTPVGDRDKSPKIQLCIEIRSKEKSVPRKRMSVASSSKQNRELIIEVTVMHLKNLIQSQSPSNSKANAPPSKKRKDTKRPTFIKVRLLPQEMIYSTELKMDKQNEDKVDLKFIEVFSFPLESLESLKERKLEIFVCDKKMTRNATTYGSVVIDLTDYKLGKPVCKWFTVRESAQPPTSSTKS